MATSSLGILVAHSGEWKAVSTPSENVKASAYVQLLVADDKMNPSVVDKIRKNKKVLKPAPQTC